MVNYVLPCKHCRRTACIDIAVKHSVITDKGVGFSASVTCGCGLHNGPITRLGPSCIEALRRALEQWNEDNETELVDRLARRLERVFAMTGIGEGPISAGVASLLDEWQRDLESRGLL